jgi:glutamate N-acetyltransferase/amino-acid N-acetyltransferase
MSSTPEAISTPHCPSGFVANGLRAGIKPSGRPDLAVVLCPQGAAAAAMFTRNAVRAAPLEVSALHLAASGDDIRAVLINAGCANAATGPEGRERAERCAVAAARLIGCKVEQVLLNSTGVIGVQLPVDRIERVLPELLAGATEEGLASAAEAILTTDTRLKHAEAHGAARHGGRFGVVGIAKGAGMIHPALRPALPHATMIALLLTDAQVEPRPLQTLLAECAETSFHRISIDGDTSTNDSVFALASGAAGAAEPEALRAALLEVCRALALQIARDGEGARKLITVHVRGAAGPEDALAAARTVATSLLVRTAVAGGDPNWGRVLAALGRSGARVVIERCSVAADGVSLFAAGAPQRIPAGQRSQVFAGSDVLIEIDLGIGGAEDRFWTCDLTEEYVRVNAEYTT